MTVGFKREGGSHVKVNGRQEDRKEKALEDYEGKKAGKVGEEKKGQELASSRPTGAASRA
jgi:hypothetical protein